MTSICRHCKKPIMRVNYALGERWDHIDGIETTGYQFCRILTAGPEVEPEGGVVPGPDLDKARSEDETPFRPPPCPNHNETQKRDGLAPWCTWCGWRHARPAVAAEKVGPSAEEKSAGARHQPWNPETGYFCSTCMGKSRETVGMVCQSCGRDYGK